MLVILRWLLSIRPCNCLNAAGTLREGQGDETAVPVIRRVHHQTSERAEGGPIAW